MKKICLTYTAKLQYWQDGAVERATEIGRWLEDNAKGRYRFEFEDYGQHGEYMLEIEEDDLVAFQLRFGYAKFANS